MRLIASTLLGLALALAGSTSADAVTTVLNARLSGSNEVPATATPATGSVTITYDDTTSILGIQAVFSGLTGTAVASHIHCCSGPMGTAPVATTVPSFAGFPLGVTSGAYSGTLDLTLASSFNPSYVTANGGSVAAARSVLVAGLLNDQAYFNIHTTAFPGGEIRGQLVSAVPEPAAWGMMLIGFGAVGYAIRRGRGKVRFSRTG